MRERSAEFRAAAECGREMRNFGPLRTAEEEYRIQDKRGDNSLNAEWWEFRAKWGSEA
jgi:hypothetical protein